jgi:hypothetical protein
MPISPISFDAPIKILLRPRWRRNDLNWFVFPGGATLALRFGTTAAMGQNLRDPLVGF